MSISNADDNDDNDIGLITESRLWHRDQYAVMLSITKVLSIFCMFLVLLSIAQLIIQEEPNYYAQEPDLRMTQIHPLQQ